MRILLADEHELVRETIAAFLENEDGFSVMQSSDLPDVERAIGSHDPFDLVLLDYEMPGMNGPEAVKKIRAMGCDSFVAGVTGNLFPEDIAYFKDCGANIVLGKPFNLRELVNSLVEFGVM